MPIRFGGKPGGNTPSARAMTDWWVKKNGCSMTPELQNLSDLADDGTKKRNLSPGTRRLRGRFHAIAGGGHTWQGGWQRLPEAIICKTFRDINASELMWEFFAKHRR